MMVSTFTLTMAALVCDIPQAPEIGDKPPQAENCRTITLGEAFRLGLEQSRAFRPAGAATGRPTGGGMAIVAPSSAGPALDAVGGPVPAAPARPDGQVAGVAVAAIGGQSTIWKARADLMAHLRSIEQSYWALARSQVDLWGRETALRMVEEVLNREKALPSGRVATADIAEAEASAEQLKIAVVKATHRVMVEEKSLREVLGLPATDGRRLVTASAPLTVPREVRKDDDQAQMLARHPQVVLQRGLMDAAEVRLAARRDLIDDPARQMLERERDEQLRFLQQVVSRSVRALAESESRVVEGTKNCETAARLKKAADARLQAQQAFFDEGRIGPDRLVDAIVQWSNALDQESQYWAELAVAVGALEESKGTLLDFDGVTLVRDPASSASAIETDATPRPSTSRIRVKVAGLRLIEVEVEDDRR